MSKNIKFLIGESSFTQYILFMPVAYLLFSDIGLNQFQIGLLQAIFGAVSLFLEVPFGYLADKFSKKVINASGDVFMALAMILYFFADGFTDALMAEILIGVGLSLTNGADTALLKAHCEIEKIDYKKLFPKLQSLKYSLNAIGAVMGGIIGAHNIRFVFLIQASIFMGAFFFAFFVKNAGAKRTSEIHPIKDMIQVTKYCLRGHAELAYRIIFSAFLGASTYYIVWFQTPIMLESGLKIKFHGIIFALASLLSLAGSLLVMKGRSPGMLKTLLALSIAYLVFGWNIGYASILLILISSMARGFNYGKIHPFIQEITPDDMQATAVSVFQMVYRVFSVTLVLLVSYMGKIKYEYGLMSAGIICLVGFLIFSLIKQRLQNTVN